MKNKSIKALEDLKYEIKHIRDPLKTKSDDWRETTDQWYVTFFYEGGSFTIDYFTGSGHRKKLSAGRTIARPPKIKSIVHSLYLDAQAADENFSSWCSNLGYSDDSIKALNTYKDCIAAAVKLKKLGLAKEYLDKEFENY